MGGIRSSNPAILNTRIVIRNAVLIILNEVKDLISRIFFANAQNNPFV